MFKISESGGVGSNTAASMQRDGGVQRGGDERGFTLVEVTIILLVLVILSAIMLPQMGNFNRLARFVKVKEDLGVICSVAEDDARRRRREHLVRGPRLLGSAGPLVGGRPAGGQRGHPDHLAAGSAENWTLPYLEAIFNEYTDGGGLKVMFNVDTLDNHLISNTPVGDAGNRWRTADRHGSTASTPCSRGAAPTSATRSVRIPGVTATPPTCLPCTTRPRADRSTSSASAVVCFSAGPDAHVDTDFNQPFGWETGDDDSDGSTARRRADVNRRLQYSGEDAAPRNRAGDSHPPRGSSGRTRPSWCVRRSRSGESSSPRSFE